MNRSTLIVVPALLTLCLGGSPAAAAKPLHFKCHADEGNSFLDGGRHAWSEVTISAGGRVDIDIKVQNKVAFNGYCFRSAYLFRDKDGNILYRTNSPQYCTDGTLVPFSGPSKRAAHLVIKLPNKIKDKVADVVVVWSPGGKDPVALLKKTLEKGQDLAKKAAVIAAVVP